jgi:hypothetical protein
VAVSLKSVGLLTDFRGLRRQTRDTVSVPVTKKKEPMMTKLLLAALAAVLMATTAQAAPPQNGNKCTSPQAKCALENGGKCNRATGFWGIGGTITRGGPAGGSHDGWLACVDRATNPYDRR